MTEALPRCGRGVLPEAADFARLTAQVNAKLAELQGLLAFLDVRPFADPQAFNQLVHTAYERRASAAALPRMRALLSAHLLRRTKADPVVANQLQLPPVEWQHGQSAPLGSAPARPLCLLSARLAALGSSVLPE